MTMSITPENLQDIAKKVKNLNDTGIEIKLITIHGHDVHLKQGEDGQHKIVGLTTKQTKDHGQAMR